MILTSYQQEHASLMRGGRPWVPCTVHRQTDTHTFTTHFPTRKVRLREMINEERQLCCARVGKGDAEPRQGLCVIRVRFLRMVTEVK